MKWLTQKQIKQAARTEKTAIECSRLHWHQMATCTLEELNSKLRQLGYYTRLIRENYCALCQKYADEKGDCVKCPLGNNNCNETNWHNAAYALRQFYRLPTQTSLAKFQTQAKIMEAIIAGLQKETK